MEFNHVSVLLNETIEGLNIKPDGIYADGTLGGSWTVVLLTKSWNSMPMYLCFLFRSKYQLVEIGSADIYHRHHHSHTCRTNDFSRCILGRSES